MTEKNLPHNNSDVANRYASQLRLPQIGIEGQNRLLESSVLIIGCGALGCISASYLAGAGVGHIALADFDTVDITNLQRQVIYQTFDAGKKKSTVLTDRIKSLNPNIKVSQYDVFVRDTFLKDILPDFDFVIDAADNPDTTYLIDRLCNQHSKSYVTAGVSGWKAQILTCGRGTTTFESIFPKPDSSTEVLPCSIEGVFGPLTGLVGCIQASEAIKSILNIGNTLSDSLQTIDLLDNTFSQYPIK